MGKQVHARFANGVFTPLEPVAFPTVPSSS